MLKLYTTTRPKSIWKGKSQRPSLTQKKTKRKKNKDFARFFLALLYFELLGKEAKAGEKLNNQNIRLFDKTLYFPIEIYKKEHRKIITGVVN